MERGRPVRLTVKSDAPHAKNPSARQDALCPRGVGQGWGTLVHKAPDGIQRLVAHVVLDAFGIYVGDRLTYT